MNNILKCREVTIMQAESSSQLMKNPNEIRHTFLIHNQTEAGKADDFRWQTASHAPESHPVLTQQVVKISLSGRIEFRILDARKIIHHQSFLHGRRFP